MNKAYDRRNKLLVKTLQAPMPFSMQSAILLLILLFLGMQTLLNGQTGQLLEKRINVDDTDRTYLLYVPQAYDGAEPWPLILNIHGYSGSPEVQMSLSRMNILADTAHYLVAYPAGLTIVREAEDALPDWLPGSGSGWSFPGFNDVRDDVRFIDALIDSVQDTYAVDSTRLYTMGLSMGGFMSMHAASELSSRIAAVAAVAGHTTNAMLDTWGRTNPLPVLFIHGTGDSVIYYNGLGVDYPSVFEAADFFVDLNNCNTEADITELPDINNEDNSTVSLFTYGGGDNNAEVRVYRVNDGGHGWPGPGGVFLPEILGPVNRDMEAEAEIVQFFNRHSLADPTTAIGDRSGLLPGGFALYPNYPNPFNPSTVLRYQLPAASKIRFTVFNLLGQKVWEKRIENQAAGQHEVVVDLGDHSSGTYFYRLEAGNSVQTRKMILLK